MKATPETILIWEQRISQRNQSGMSIASWCKANGIKKGTYQYWNKKLNKNLTINNETEFADVSSIISSTAPPYKVTEISKKDDFKVLLNNVTITVPSNFNKDSFKELMEVIANL